MTPNVPFFEKTKSLRYWVQHVLPLVYDDSLSFYELLSKVVEKINILIENNNKLPDFIVDMIKEQLKLDNLIPILKELIREVINMEYYTKAEIDAMLAELNATINAEIDDFEHRVDNKIYANDLSVQYLATSYTWSKDNRQTFFDGYYDYTPAEGQCLCYLDSKHILQWYSMGRNGGWDSRNAPVLMRKFYLGDTNKLSDAEIVDEVMFDPERESDAVNHIVGDCQLCHPSGAFYKADENAIYVSTMGYRESGDTDTTYTNEVIKLNAETYRKISSITVEFPSSFGHAGAMAYDATTDTIYFQTGRYTAKVKTKTNCTWTLEIVKELSTYWTAPLSRTGTFGVQGFCVDNGIQYLIHSRSNCVIVNDINDGTHRPTKIYGLPEVDCYGHYLRYPEGAVIRPDTGDIFITIWSHLGDAQNKGTFFANYLFKANPKYNVCDSANIEKTSGNAGTNYSYPYLNVDSTQNIYSRAYFNGTADYPFFSLQETMYAAMYRPNKCYIRVEPNSVFDEELSLFGTGVEFDRFFTCNSIYLRNADVRFSGKLKINNTVNANAVRCYQSTMVTNGIQFMNGNTSGTLVYLVDSNVTFDEITGSKTNDSNLLSAYSSRIKFTFPNGFRGAINLDDTICDTNIATSALTNTITLSNRSATGKIIDGNLDKYIVLDESFVGYVCVMYRLTIGSTDYGYQTTGRIFKNSNSLRVINVFITDDIYIHFVIGATGVITAPTVNSISGADTTNFSVSVYGIYYNTTA